VWYNDRNKAVALLVYTAFYEGGFCVIAVWTIATVVLLLVEVATVSLVTIWFAIGSLCALVATILGAGFWAQIIIFIVVSGGVLALLRPLAKKYINGRKSPTNADRVIGMVCPVTEDIDNISGTGAVSVDGKVWTARSSSGENIPKGTLVKPVSIQGVKLIVEKAEETAEV
jgi:membrane protein implicated in regulation of membrane protease activity